MACFTSPTPVMTLGPVDFQVIAKLAEDEAAEVFLANAPTLGQAVVVKTLRRELTSDPLRLSRFLEECQRLGSLEHPGIARLLGAGQLADGGFYLMSEYVEGGDLAAMLRDGVLSAEQVKSLALPLCDALRCIHERGIIHGDLKAANVLLGGGLFAFNPKLSDIGLLLFAEDRAGSADPSADLYALGALLYECLSGGPPLMAATDKGPPPALPRAAQAIAHVIYRCLAPRPADRFASAAEVARAFKSSGGFQLQSPVAAAGLSPTLARPPAPEPGRELGNYVIEKLLGEGAMGQVFRARHRRLGRQVALKLLKPEHAQNADLLVRFFQEARSVNQINHEHIVEIHDFVEERLPNGGVQAYCVMELLKGKTLAEAMDEGPLSVARTVKIAQQVCAGLGAAHRVGVVHRDVKPDNIFLTVRQGVADYVKLLDFGVAKLVSSEPHGGTVAGTVIGTPEYMGPEQAAGGEVDARSDVWSLGVVMYELLTLRRPFDAPAFGQLVLDINNKPVPPLPERSTRGEPLPRAVRDVVMKCLQKDPNRRFQSMDSLGLALAESLRPETAPAPTASVLSSPPPASPPSVAPSNLAVPTSVASLESSDEDIEALAAQFRPKTRRWVTGVLFLAFLALTGDYFRENPSQVPASWTGLYSAGRGAALALISHNASRALPEPLLPSLAAVDKVAAVAVSAFVKIAVHTVPEGALVERTDTGEKWGVTPLTRTLPRMGVEITLKLTRADYLPAERAVRLSEDAVIEVDLARRAGPRPKRKSREAPAEP